MNLSDNFKVFLIQINFKSTRKQSFCILLACDQKIIKVDDPGISNQNMIISMAPKVWGWSILPFLELNSYLIIEVLNISDKNRVCYPVTFLVAQVVFSQYCKYGWLQRKTVNVHFLIHVSVSNIAKVDVLRWFLTGIIQCHLQWSHGYKTLWYQTVLVFFLTKNVQIV